MHKLMQSPIECDGTASSGDSLSRENSTSSFCTDYNQMEHFLAEEDHDKAFIQESTLLSENAEEIGNPVEVSKKGNLSETKNVNHFSQEAENMDMTTSTDASDTSVCTVIFNGHAVSPKPQMSGILAHKIQQVNRLEERVNNEEHASAAFILKSNTNFSDKDNHTESLPIHGNCSALDCKKEGSTLSSRLLQNVPTRDLQSQAPKCDDLHVSLPITNEMKSMLSRIGGDKNITPVKMGMHEETVQKTTVLLPSNESCKTEKGFVSNVVKELSLKIDNDIAQKHASPLRFPNSVSRHRGISPIRIPRVFTALDSDDVNFKSIGRKSPLRFKPNLPIGTSLVRSDSVKRAKNQITLKEVGSARNAENAAPKTTPQKGNSEFNGAACNSALHENCKTNSSTCVCFVDSQTKDTNSMTAFTPEKFKSLNTMRNYISPAKPVKRLHGSPRSPRFHGKSPRKTTLSNKRFLKRGTLSPIPSHITDWNI